MSLRGRLTARRPCIPPPAACWSPPGHGEHRATAIASMARGSMPAVTGTEADVPASLSKGLV